MAHMAGSLLDGIAFTESQYGARTIIRAEITGYRIVVYAPTKEAAVGALLIDHESVLLEAWQNRSVQSAARQQEQHRNRAKANRVQHVLNGGLMDWSY